ncbi:SET domain-containing protein [Rhizophagus clarus]|uniref:SET domain-containing protein n=1 Tax=Rhizophagus clarus TaxID=94130 RepID=A0A8H3QK44_9GLOM|nr:SET domain-containing protein [Rhizophagus clarus]
MEESHKQKKFIHWLTENGVIFPKLKLIKNGIFSTNIINENEIFATIPFSIIINDKIANKTLPYLKDLSSSYHYSSLIIFLIYERLLGEKSFYFPYINILPKHVNSLLYYDENEISYLLKGTDIENFVIERKLQLKKCYEEILESLPSDGILKENMSWELFLWAYSIVASRSFPNRLIDPDDTESKKVLIPLADSLNHRPRQKITWQFSDGNSMRLIAGETIECGKEIYNNYGPKANRELLLAYGFCIKDNPDDWAIIKLNFDQDPERDEKFEILKISELVDFTHYITKDCVPNKLLSQCRIIELNYLEIIYFRKYYQDSYQEKGSDLFNFVGYRNEICVLEILIMLLNRKLNAIIVNEQKQKTKDMINRDDDLSRQVKIFRDGQKEILQSAIAKIQSLELKVLSRAVDDFNENRISKPPFLFNNTTYEFIKENNNDSSSESNNNYLEIKETLFDSLLITSDKAMKMDQKFSKAIHNMFEDDELENENDVILILFLIHESNNKESYWKNFFDAVKDFKITLTQKEEEIKLQELSDFYENLSQSISSNDLSSELFSEEIFTLENFVWASNLLDSFQINLINKEGKEYVGIMPL